MRCPFCGEELQEFGGGDFLLLYYCDNLNCNLYHIMGQHTLWQELIRTRKALDIAVDALEEYEDADSYDCDGNWCSLKYSTAHNALKQIRALEQKE